MPRTWLASESSDFSEKKEISEQDIQKEIKDTLARLSNKGGKSKSSKKIWEIPKGMNNKNESSINAAIREFSEETGINNNDIDIL